MPTSEPRRPRELIVDLFGEYLRFGDARVGLTQLTELLSAFGVAPPTVRMTLTRLRRDGWFTNQRCGRETRYRPTATMVTMLEEGRERIFGPTPTTWSGEWTMVLYRLSESARQDREQLRNRLAYQGFGVLSTSTWLAPGGRRSLARGLIGDLALDQVEILCCRSDGRDHDAALARRCWELGPLAEQYRAFIAQHQPLESKADDVTGGDALVERTLLVSDYRRFPFEDPQLPAHLYPAPWPGTEAHRLFRSLHQRLGSAARAHVSEVVGHDVVDTLTAGLSRR